MTKTEIVYLWTKDKLRLPGVHFEPEKKDIGVLGGKQLANWGNG